MVSTHGFVLVTRVFHVQQEDASIANGSFDNEKAIFGVFDGHGGGEVAQYVKRHFE